MLYHFFFHSVLVFSAELSWNGSVRQLMAKPDRPTMPWFGSQVNRNGKRVCVLVSVHLLEGGRSYFPNPSEIWFNDHLVNMEPTEASHNSKLFYEGNS